MGIGDWGLGPIPNPQSPKIFLIIVKEVKYKKIFENLNFL